MPATVVLKAPATLVRRSVRLEAFSSLASVFLEVLSAPCPGFLGLAFFRLSRPLPIRADLASRRYAC